MENKLKAVEWLINEFKQLGIYSPTLKDKCEQAKQMEKEQITDAYWDGGQDIPLTEERCEQYYKETFNK
jgi:hypothetical protein